MVIADLDITGADEVVAEVKKAGGFVYNAFSISAELLKRFIGLQALLNVT